MSQSVEPQHPTNPACRNCGATLTGPYCGTCGQAEQDGHPPTVRHFCHDLIHELEHVDGKIFRTFKALFFQPGKLTKEYWAGRVVSWVRPIRIFLIVAALHLLIARGVGPLNYQVHLERSPTGDLNVNVTGRATADRHRPGYSSVSESERREFFERFEKTYTAIRYSSVLLFALASWALYRRRQPYFVSHLIAGLHFYSFWYSLALIVSLPGRLNPSWNSLSLLSGAYVYLALGRLFRERWYVRLLKSLILYGVMLIAELALGYLAAVWAERVVR